MKRLETLINAFKDKEVLFVTDDKEAYDKFKDKVTKALLNHDSGGKRVDVVIAYTYDYQDELHYLKKDNESIVLWIKRD